MKFRKRETPVAKKKPVKVKTKMVVKKDDELIVPEPPKKVKRKTKALQVVEGSPLYDFLLDGIKIIDEMPSWDYFYRMDVPLLLSDGEGNEHKVSNTQTMAIRPFRRGLYVTESSGANGKPIAKALEAFIATLEGLGVYITGHIHASGQPIAKDRRKKALDDTIERERAELDASLARDKERAKKKQARAKEVDESDEDDILTLDDEPEPKVTKPKGKVKIKIRKKK